MVFKQLARLGSQCVVGQIKDINGSVQLNGIIPFNGIAYTITALAYYGNNDRNAGVMLRRLEIKSDSTS